MLCDLGGILFEIKKREFEKINRTLSFTFAKKSRLGKNPTFQSVNGYEESFEIEGKLISRSNSDLKPIESLAKKKEPVRLTLGSGESLEVIIEKISEGRSCFMDNGHYVKNGFKISLRTYSA